MLHCLADSWNSFGDKALNRIFSTLVFRQFFKSARLTVFSHPIPIEIPAIHNHIYARRQYLSKCKRASKVKKAIGGGSKGIRNHCAGEHNGFIFDISFGEMTGKALRVNGLSSYWPVRKKCMPTDVCCSADWMTIIPSITIWAS